MNVFAKFDEIPSMIRQDIKETKRIPLRIAKGNNSNNSGPYPLIFKSNIGHILMCLQNLMKFRQWFFKILKKQNVTDTKTFRTQKRFRHMVGQRENSISSHKHSLRGSIKKKKKKMVGTPIFG